MSFNTFIGIWLTRHVADKSALAAINRALRGCGVRSHDPWYFVKVHYKSLGLSNVSEHVHFYGSERY